MEKLVLRPDMRTGGGEVNDILLNGKYVGLMTLVYRENNRLCGSVQLESEALSEDGKTMVESFARRYIQSLVAALEVPESEVIVTCSEYADIIETGPKKALGDERDMPGDDNGEPDIVYDVSDRPRFVDIDPREIEELEMDAEDGAVSYELVIVGEKRNQVEYHVYDHRRRWVAEAFMTVHGVNVVGEINWVFDPTDEEIEMITDLIVSDFTDQTVETFVIDMKFDGEEFETMELAREDLLRKQKRDTVKDARDSSAEDFSIVMIRDDGDALTYDIYRQSRGGIPVGTAMVDIRSREATGYIDFNEQSDEEEREMIASLLMRELDKEREFNTLNLTMIYQNEPFEEMHFSTETVH